MRVEAAGDFAVDATVEEALAALADLEGLARCLPGAVHGVHARDDGGVSVELTARAGGAAHDLRVRVYLDEVDEAAGRVAYTGHGLGSRAKVDLDGEFVLEADGDATAVAWRGAADVGGLLSSLNRGVAAAAVREGLEETADNVRRALDREAAG